MCYMHGYSTCHANSMCYRCTNSVICKQIAHAIQITHAIASKCCLLLVDLMILIIAPNNTCYLYSYTSTCYLQGTCYNHAYNTCYLRSYSTCYLEQIFKIYKSPPSSKKPSISLNSNGYSPVGTVRLIY